MVRPGAVRVLAVETDEPAGIVPSPRTEATAVYGWGSEPPPCSGPCTPLVQRVQTSTVQADNRGLEMLAVDGDLATAWCAKGRVGEKLVLSSGRERVVRRLRMAGWDGENAAVTGFDLVTDRGDRVPIELEAPSGDWGTLREHPPVVDVLLEGVRFVQVEVTSVQGEGPVCIAEIVLLGEP